MRRRTPERQPRHGRTNAIAPAPRIPPFVIAMALALLDLIVYWPVRTFALVNWDDPSYITENPAVAGGLSWTSVKWALTTGHSPYWHPMTWLSHLLDISLFGTDAGWYHVTNLLLHIANTVLVFAIFRRMTRARWASAFVAAVFAVHPLHVESVAWIAERKDVLSTFFWALAVLAYIGYAERPRAPRYAAVLVLFALALASKPMVVTLPLVLLLLDAWPLRRAERAGWRRLVLEKVPLFALAAAASIATIVIQHRVGAMARLDALPWSARVSTAAIGYVAYLGKAIWPANLAAFYPYHDHSAAAVAAAVALLVSLTALSLANWRRRPHLAIGWLWFVTTLAPVSGVLQAGEQAIADRFMYVPLIGLAMAVAWEAPSALARLRVPRPAVSVVAFGLIAACAVTAHAQVEHWSDSIALWTHGVAATPDSYVAYENLAQAQRERGLLDEALANYARALAHAPVRSPAYQAVIYNSMGLVLTREGRIDEARQQFERAVAADPTFAEPQGNLANALASDGRFGDAIGHYERAVQLKPKFTEAHLGLGGALLSEGRAEEAIPQYREALRLDPSLAQAYNGLGAALAQQGRDAEALAQYQTALRLKPDLATAHYNLAALLVKQAKPEAARAELEAALAADPDYAPARALLQSLTRIP